MKKKLKIKQKPIYTFTYKAKFLQIGFNWLQYHKCQCGGRMKMTSHRVRRYLIEILPNYSFPFLVTTEIPKYFCSSCGKYNNGSLKSSSEYGATIKEFAKALREKKCSYGEISDIFFKKYKILIQPRTVANWTKELKLKNPTPNKGVTVKIFDGTVLSDEVRGEKALVFYDGSSQRVVGSRRFCELAKEAYIKKGKNIIEVTKPMKNKSGETASIIKHTWKKLHTKLITYSPEFLIGQKLLRQESQKIEKNRYFWIMKCKVYYWIPGLKRKITPVFQDKAQAEKEIQKTLVSYQHHRDKHQKNKVHMALPFFKELIRLKGKDSFLPSRWERDLDSYATLDSTLNNLALIMEAKRVSEASEDSLNKGQEDSIDSAKLLVEEGVIDRKAIEVLGTLYNERKNFELEKSIREAFRKDIAEGSALIKQTLWSLTKKQHDQDWRLVSSTKKKKDGRTSYLINTQEELEGSKLDDKNDDVEEEKKDRISSKRYQRKHPYCIKIGELKKGLVRLGVKVSLQTIRRRDKEIKSIHNKGVVVIHHGEEKKIDEVRYYNEEAQKRAAKVFNVDMGRAKKLFKKLSNRE